VNSNVQLCLHNRLAVGGGAIEGTDREDDPEIKDHEWGFGLTVTANMLKGTSSPCLTFGSPSLSAVHSDGSEFEIMNLELWTLTSCSDLDDAERMEHGKLFLAKSFS
jgi:TLD